MASRMSKKTGIILAIVIIVVVAVVAIALSHNSSKPSDSTPQSEKAPDFTLPTMAGANITLSKLEGMPVVLNFWSISCYWCKMQLPYLENVAQQRKGEITIIAINFLQDVSTVQNFLQSFLGKNETSMIVALDSNVETFVNYCQNYTNPRGAIPFTLFVDREGIVQYVKIGAFASETDLQDTIDSVF